ncbi:hypothetical protein TNCV_867171 [Trichonephila clavipes]|nr:hypothetical protein TNCV_867171 [Trichonephila clavipes]
MLSPYPYTFISLIQSDTRLVGPGNVFPVINSPIMVLTGPGEAAATAHEDQRLRCPPQYTCPLGAEVPEQMSRSGGQFEAKSPVFSLQASLFGLAIHQNDHEARRRFVEWAQNEIAVVPDFHKRILFSDEAHFWLNGYVNKQNCRIWSEANPQVYVETPLHPEKLTVWCALWAGGILLQKR